MNERSVYLDYNATTPVDESVCAVVHTTLHSAWANPSSTYPLGVKARDVLNHSRTQVACMIGAGEQDIVFTSGGTESNNMVIASSLRYHNSYRQDTATPHIITTSVEHDSVRNYLQQLKQELEVTYVKPCQLTGQILASDVRASITDNTCLVTVMMANNETGTIHDIRAISETVKQYNGSYRKCGCEVLLHTDAAQAIGKVDVNVNDLQVDFLTIAGHKFYGPRVGALYVRDLLQRNILFPVFYGGGQERGYRPGTENTAMIAGLGQACHLVTSRLEEYKQHMQHVRDYLEATLKNLVEGAGYTVYVNGVFEGCGSVLSPRLPNTSNISICKHDGPAPTSRDILSLCPAIQASTGAACHSNTSSNKGSRVLREYHIPEGRAARAIRLSVGRETTKEDLDFALKHLYNAVVLADNKFNST